MNKRSIMLDIDGVLSDFVTSAIPIANRRLGKDIPLSYRPQEYWWPDRLSKEDWGPMFDEIKSTYNFWYNLMPIKENVEALRDFYDNIRVSRSEYAVYFITSRPDTAGLTALDQTNRWLLELDLLRTNCSVLVVRQPEHKPALIRSLDLQASIDDKLESAIESSKIDNHQSYLLDYPYNRTGRKLGDNIIVVSSLRAFLDDQRRAVEAARGLEIERLHAEPVA